MARKVAPSIRSILVDLPEPLMLRLVNRAKDEATTAHALAARVLTDWLVK